MRLVNGPIITICCTNEANVFFSKNIIRILILIYWLNSSFDEDHFDVIRFNVCECVRLLPNRNKNRYQKLICGFVHTAVLEHWRIGIGIKMSIQRRSNEKTHHTALASYSLLTIHTRVKWVHFCANARKNHIPTLTAAAAQSSHNIAVFYSVWKMSDLCGKCLFCVKNVRFVWKISFLCEKCLFCV